MYSDERRKLAAEKLRSNSADRIAKLASEANLNAPLPDISIHAANDLSLRDAYRQAHQLRALSCVADLLPTEITCAGLIALLDQLMERVVDQLTIRHNRETAERIIGWTPFTAEAWVPVQITGCPKNSELRATDWIFMSINEASEVINSSPITHPKVVEFIVNSGFAIDDELFLYVDEPEIYCDSATVRVADVTTDPITIHVWRQFR